MLSAKRRPFCLGDAWHIIHKMILHSAVTYVRLTYAIMKPDLSQEAGDICCQLSHLFFQQDDNSLTGSLTF